MQFCWAVVVGRAFFANFTIKEEGISCLSKFYILYSLGSSGRVEGSQGLEKLATARIRIEFLTHPLFCWLTISVLSGLLGWTRVTRNRLRTRVEKLRFVSPWNSQNETFGAKVLKLCWDRTSSLFSSCSFETQKRETPAPTETKFYSHENRVDE